MQKETVHDLIQHFGKSLERGRVHKWSFIENDMVCMKNADSVVSCTMKDAFVEA